MDSPSDPRGRHHTDLVTSNVPDCSRAVAEIGAGIVDRPRAGSGIGGMLIATAVA